MVEVPARDRDAPLFLSAQALEKVSLAQTGFGQDHEKNRQAGDFSPPLTHMVSDMGMEFFI